MQESVRAPHGALQSPTGTFANSILKAIPMSELDQISPMLQPVFVERSGVLFVPDEVLTHGYFPESGVVSELAVMETGEAVEVGLVGHEGMLGMDIFLGGERGKRRVLVQIGPMSGSKIKAAALREAFDELPVFRSMLLQFVCCQHAAVSQGAACNGLHEVEARLAKWLLLCHDRVHEDHLGLTQEFLANMLGVRRTTVTLVAGTLHRAGLIEYRRGKITVLKRAELEDAACECYPLLKAQFELLVGKSTNGESV